MKVTRRKSTPGGLFIVSVPKIRIQRVEEALTFLEEIDGKNVSQIVTDLLLAEAQRQGWPMPPQEQDNGNRSDDTNGQ